MKKIIIFLAFTLQANYLMAGSIYTCTNADGSIIMQSNPCSFNQSSKRLDYNFKKNYETPWYKKNNIYIQDNNNQTYNKKLSNKNIGDEDNYSELQCNKLKNQLKANDDLRFDIKKRRDYSKSQKNIYKDKSYKLIKMIKKSCNNHKYKPKNY